MIDITKILLADDDRDDCLLFSDALAELPFATSLITVNDGEELMSHLLGLSVDLPDAIFLDLNMPRKKGVDCLMEIKRHSSLKELPVIIYSTSYYGETADLLYKHGAHYYICKPPDFEDLKKTIHLAILFVQVNSSRPSKEDFLISLTNASDAHEH